MRKLLIVVALLAVLTIQPLASAAEPTNSVVYRIQKTYHIPNNSSVDALNVVAAPLLIFDNRSVWASQQVLSENIQLSDGTYEIIRTDDNRFVRASLGTISAGASKTIIITQIVKVDYVDPGVTSSMVQGSIPANLNQYTMSIANLWESSDPAIDGKAHELTDNYPNYYDKAKQIFDFVKEYLTYVKYGPEHSALWAYLNRTGDCSEYTHLFIALARAIGIPAQHVSGYGYRAEYGTNLNDMGHAWAFIYLPSVGWVPIDTRWASPEWNFCKLSPDHLVMTTSDGTGIVKDSKIDLPSDCGRPAYRYYGPTDPRLTVDRTETIVREVAVEPQLSMAQYMEGDIQKFYVTVKNEGAQTVTNLNVELIADNSYFEVPGVQSISSLGAGNNQVVTFNVRVKGSVENSKITAHVTYDSTYGTFLAEGQMILTVPPSALPEGWLNTMLIALIGVLVGVLVVAVALLRR